MTKLRMGLLIVAGVLVLLVAAAGTAFYFVVYKPVGAPLMAIAGAPRLEEQKLLNKSSFAPPASGAPTPEQVSRFVTVEEAVLKHLGNDIAALMKQQEVLERANEAGALSVRTTLSAFGEIRYVFLNAKVAEIDAMNSANFSKAEFEWVRKALYRAAGIRLAQLDSPSPSVPSCRPGACWASSVCSATRRLPIPFVLFPRPLPSALCPLP